MTKPDKQMPDNIYLFPLDQDMVWCDTDESHEDDESYKYISETKHLSEIAALEEKHREDTVNLLSELREKVYCLTEYNDVEGILINREELFNIIDSMEKGE